VELDLNIKEEKVKAELLAAFGSFKFIPMPIVFVTNNLNPKLIIHVIRIELRVGFFTRNIEYDKIGKVDIFLFGKRTKNLVITKKYGIGKFVFNFKRKLQLIEFLEILKAKDCKLTKKAILEIEKYKLK